MKYDALVIGGGPNGLAAAITLARAGRKTLVVERRATVGGLAAPVEFHPGHTAPGVLHDRGLVRPFAVSRLGLSRFGLKLRHDPLRSVALEEGGKGLIISDDVDATSTALAARNRDDAVAYREYRSFLRRVEPVISRIFDNPPPGLTPETASGFAGMIQTGLAVRRLSARDLNDLARIAPMSLADWMHEQFHDARLKAHLSVPALEGAFAGPWSPGSAAPLLLWEAVGGAKISGGLAALVKSLEGAAAAAGVEIQTESRVSELLLDRERVVGVRVGRDETIDAKMVLASCDPRQLFLDLVPAGRLPVQFEDLCRNIRARGTTVALMLAIDGRLEFRHHEGEAIEAATTGGDLATLEQAFDHVKYRRFSERPVLDIRVPTRQTPSLAPPGHHVMSILASYAPHDIDGGWSDSMREGFTEAVLDVLSTFVPTIREQLLGVKVLSPHELAHEYRLPNGHLHHGEHALDQLFVMRPNHLAAQYRTPIAGLFLCGSGSHPGGGVTLAPGILGADAALARGES